MEWLTEQMIVAATLGALAGTFAVLFIRERLTHRKTLAHLGTALDIIEAEAITQRIPVVVTNLVPTAEQRPN